MVSLVTVTPSVMRFGQCPVSDRRDIRAMITNRSDAPVTFSFPKTAQFNMTPSKGTLGPLQSRSVVVSFQPSQMGKFKSVIQMVISGGLSTVGIKMVGESEYSEGKRVTIAGVDKIKADFDKKMKFVDPAKVLIEQIEEERMKKTVDKETMSLTSSDRDHVYGTSSVFTGEVTVPLPSESMAAYIESRKNSSDYLTATGQKRQLGLATAALKRTFALGATDRTDPIGVDMGMERGLDEPLMKMPIVEETVWLKKKRDSGRARVKLPVDDSKIIPIKFKEGPTLPEDIRQCTKEISSEQLGLISCSHKTINFGQVSVNSITTKSLAILNELPNNILVRLEGLSTDLNLSKPLSQMIPGGATVAGFDLTFHSKTLGKTRSTFSWIVNGFHSYTVTVLTEVIPIVLGLSKDIILFRFPDESVEPNVAEILTINNPGNALADFSLSLPSGSAFILRPDKGQIPPGKSAIITVIWAPKLGKKNEAEVSVAIPGGVPQSFKLQGDLKETRVAFETKLLAMGAISVGNEASYTVKLKNLGTNLAVFYMTQGEIIGDREKEGSEMVMTPEHGSILPGDFATLKISILPKGIKSLDNLFVSATLRGGKSLMLKMSGQAVIPQIKLIEPSFLFGEVTVGAEYRVPLTLVNESLLAVDLILDLSKYPDFYPLITPPGSLNPITLDINSITAGSPNLTITSPYTINNHYGFIPLIHPFLL
jgi:hypothetical protein